MADPFDRFLNKIHDRAPTLALEVGGSAFVAHRSSTDTVVLSGTPNLEWAFKDFRGGEGGRLLLRELFGRSSVVMLEYLKVPERAQIGATKARREAWLGRSSTLRRWADEVNKLPEQGRRPFLLYLVSGGEQICCGSSEGQQLVDSAWWRSTIIPACSGPSALPFLPFITANAAATRRPRKPANKSAAATGGRQQQHQQQQQQQQQGPEPQPFEEPATCSWEHDLGMPWGPETDAVLGQPPEPEEELLAALTAPHAPEGSADWYGQCLANNPALIRPKQLTRGKFALPNYAPNIERAAKRITSEPVQVRMSTRLGLAFCCLHCGQA